MIRRFLIGIFLIFPMRAIHRTSFLACRCATFGSPSVRPWGIDCLALRPTHFRLSDPDPGLVNEILRIKDFLSKIHPNAEVKIVPEGQEPMDPHWERVPFTWRGMTVWIKRHHVYDYWGSA